MRAYRYRYRKRDGWLGVVMLTITVFASLAAQEGWFDKALDSAEHNQPGLYKVTQFVDGDTVTIDMNGHSEKIRLIGVDTPETHKPNAPVQCYGPAAAAYVKNKIGSQRLRLESDSLTTNRDRYDRLLRYVYLQDGTNLNEDIIKNGYGFYYPYFPFTKSDRFKAAQESAQKNNKGIWQNCNPRQTDRGGYVSNDI